MAPVSTAVSQGFDTIQRVLTQGRAFSELSCLQLGQQPLQLCQLQALARAGHRHSKTFCPCRDLSSRACRLFAVKNVVMRKVYKDTPPLVGTVVQKIDIATGLSISSICWVDP